MQFVQVKYNAADRRTYTYHNDGEPVAVGQTIEVPTPHGTRRVTVEGTTDEKPRFPTKAILGVVAEDDADE